MSKNDTDYFKNIAGCQMKVWISGRWGVRLVLYPPHWVSVMLMVESQNFALENTLTYEKCSFQMLLFP